MIGEKIMALDLFGEERTRSLSFLNRLTSAVWIFDIDHSRVAWANEAALTLWRAESLDELVSRDMSVDMSVAVAERLRQYQRDFREHDASFSEAWTLYPGGVPTNLDVDFSGYTFADGRVGMTCEARRHREDVPDVIRSAEALLHTSMMISLYCPDGRPLYQNPAARRSVADAVTRLEQRFENRFEYGHLIAELKASGESRQSARIVTANGVRWHEVTARECLDAVSGTRAYLFSEIDITELKEAERKTNYLANHDILTGLWNRHYLNTTVPEELAVAEDTGASVVFLIIDLDNFKTINDTLGHAIGDQLLLQVGKTLKAVTRDTGFVVRLGGDEFFICLNNTPADFEVDAFCERIVWEFQKNCQIDETSTQTKVSIGVSVFPDDGRQMTDLLKNADLALYEAKNSGRNTFRRFSNKLRVQNDARVTLENDLRTAVEEGQFELYYQPRVAVDSQQILGAEALLRWNHPTRGLVFPGDFIPACEATGLITPIGEWVLEEAARQQADLAQQGHDITISVNLSPQQFTSPTLAACVSSLAERTGCDPTKIELEITESMLMNGKNTVVDMLRSFRDLGFGIAIDDFGTGYSNLLYIQRFPITSLKIERSFVGNIETNSAIAALILSFCKQLEVTAIAEGVETRDQLNWLNAEGCREFQGYLFSPAVTGSAFRDLLAH